MAPLSVALAPGVYNQLRELKALWNEGILDQGDYGLYRASAFAAHADPPAGAAAMARAPGLAAAAITGAAPPAPPAARKATAKRGDARQSKARLARGRCRSSGGRVAHADRRAAPLARPRRPTECPARAHAPSLLQEPTCGLSPTFIPTVPSPYLGHISTTATSLRTRAPPSDGARAPLCETVAKSNCSVAS